MYIHRNVSERQNYLIREAKHNLLHICLWFGAHCCKSSKVAHKSMYTQILFYTFGLYRMHFNSFEVNFSRYLLELEGLSLNSF